MNFINGIFFGFIAITFLAYFAIPIRYRWIVLLCASVIFYCSWGIEKLPFVLATTLLAFFAAKYMDKRYEALENYLAEHQIGKEEKRKLQQETKKQCKKVLLITVACILLVLIYVKTGGKSAIVPLGISYYTLSVIGYLADVYWKKEKAEKNFLHFALFVLYFPKILQGPLSRHKYLGKQLVEGHAFDYKRFCYGLQLMLWGYFKKLVIADRLSQFVTEVFTNYREYSGIILIFGAFFGTLQLYCDFSGCMDMAAGMSEVLGINLEKNFNHPFFSRSAAEFWRRWHITLGNWFKDYIYMPLVVSPRLMKIAQKVKKIWGNRAGKAVVSIIPLSVVWLLTGIWHGTGMNYVMWGIYWGVLIIVSTVFEPEIKRLTKFLHINTEAHSFKIFQMIRTFLLFSIGRIITIPGDLRVTGEIFKKIVTELNIWELFDGTLYTVALNRPNFILVIICILLLWVVSMLQEKGSVRDMFAEINLVICWGIYYIALFAVIILGVYGAGFNAGSFIYMNY